MSVQEQSLVCTNEEGRVPEYICVDYPGNVVNVQNMMATLGGTEMISKVYSESNRRLELRFRPDDVYCKPVCGERTASTALLVRVRRRVKKAKAPSRGSVESSSPQGASSSSPSGRDERVDSTLLGIVNTTYTFNTMCDAQYLPLHSTSEGSSSSSSSLPYSCFTPQNLELPTWLHEDPQQLFLPPAAFSRMDTPQFFFFRGDGSESFIKQEHNRANKSKTAADASSTPQSSEHQGTASTNASSEHQSSVTTTTTATGGDVSTSTIDCTSTSTGNMVLSSPAPNVICRTRQRRTLFAIFRNFHEETPAEPDPQAMEQLQLKFLQRSISPIYRKLKDLFQERPIWSKNALKVKLGFGTDNLKYLLPTLGYYFNTGPWRNLWVRFGYDPRVQPGAFSYQTFDYRLKQTGRLKSLIEAKRSYSKYMLHYKSSSTSKRKISVIQSDLLGNDNSTQGSPNAASQGSEEPLESGASTSKTGASTSNSASSTSNSGSSTSNSGFSTSNSGSSTSKSGSSTSNPGSSTSNPGSSTSNSGSSTSKSGSSTSKSGVETAEIMKRTLGKMKRDEEEEPQLPDEEEGGADVFKDEVYIFRPGTIPPYRQMFYQYCDLLVPEVKRVISDSVVTMDKQLQCDERSGWLTREAEDECRRIITRLIDEAASKRLEFEKD